MSEFPKTHFIVYTGRRLDDKKKVFYRYEALNADLTYPKSPRVLCFTARIKAAHGIGVIAKVNETKEGTFDIGRAAYVDSVTNNERKFSELRPLAAGWRTEDEAAAGIKEIERKSKGEDVWFSELAHIKRAYRYSNRGERAVIVAKLIQYLETP